MKNNKENIRKSFLRTVALTLSLVMLLFSLVGCSDDDADEGVNLLGEDLSKYITLSESDYKSFHVNDVFYEISDFDVDVEILKLLYSNRGKTPLYDGKYYRNKVVSAGDEAFIYYRGYTVDENGVETDFDGGCNFFSGSAYQLGIGSGGFVPGFELGLVGVLPGDYETLDIIDSGKVRDGDVVFLTYTVISPDKNESKTSARIDLSREDIDDIYGDGFREFLLGGADGSKPITIGEGILGTRIFPVDNGSATYYNMKVTGVMREESDPITIDVRFPSDYKEASLRGKWVKFDVYVEKVQYYEAPEYNDAFVTDTLKITDETLLGIEGEGSAEKYRELIRAELVAEYEETRLSVIEEAFWDYIVGKVTVKELPETLVQRFYNEYYTELSTQHAYYQSYYPDLESFGRAYYSIEDPTVTVSEYMTEKARAAALEKVVFYHIMKAEGLVPSEEVLLAESNKYIDDYLERYLAEGYKTDYAACKTDEERAAFRSDLRIKIIDNFGMEYFEEMVYYDVFLEKIPEFAIITK